MVQVQLTFKGNGKLHSDWYIAHYAQNTPFTHSGFLQVSQSQI